jgi:hypothetical protein
MGCSRALLLGDEEPGDLALDVQRNENRTRLGGGLHTRGDIWRVAEDLACRLHDNRPAFNPNPREQRGRPFASILGVDLRY